MTKQTLIIEKFNIFISKNRQYIQGIVSKNGTNKNAAAKELRVFFNEYSNFQVGCGGSHIWACDESKQRVFLITGY